MMMTSPVLLLFLLCLLCLLSSTAVPSRYAKKKPVESTPKPKPIQLNTEHLPSITEILQELGLSTYLDNFIRMGVTETRLLLRLSSMDFQIMSYDWDLPAEEITKLRAHINILIIKATVKEEDTAVKPEYLLRSKLDYGRVYIPAAVQSFEYKQASFGNAPPIGPLEIVLGDPIHGCPPGTFSDTLNGKGNTTDGNSEESDGANIDEIGNENEKNMENLLLTPVIPNYTGKVLVIMRGQCTFLSKALYALETNASALIIINDEDRLESPSSGLSVDKTITRNTVDKINNKLSIISMSNTSLAKISHSLKSSPNPLSLHVIPLKCGAGGTCVPLLEEEKKIQSEVTWGTIRLSGEGEGEDRSSQSFEFITSNFGGVLVAESFSVFSVDSDGCEDFEINAESNEATNDVNQKNNVSQTNGVKNPTPFSPPFAVILDRGSCQFDRKALRAQKAGAQLLIVVDVKDNPLQRMGGTQPESGYVGIPSILVTKVCGDYMRANMGKRLQGHLTPSSNALGFDRWVELAYTEWAEGTEDQLIQIEGMTQKYLQTESYEITAWLGRKREGLERRKQEKEIKGTDEL